MEYKNNGTVKVKETLEQHLIRVFKIDLRGHARLRSIVTTQLMVKFIDYLHNKEIKVCNNQTGHNYNYNVAVGIDDGDRLNGSGISKGWTIDEEGNRIRGNNIYWEDLYIAEKNTIESYTNELEMLSSKVEKAQKSIEADTKNMEDLKELINHMKLSKLEELDKDEFLVHKKLLKSF